MLIDNPNTNIEDWEDKTPVFPPPISVEDLLHPDYRPEDDSGKGGFGIVYGQENPTIPIIRMKKFSQEEERETPYEPTSGEIILPGMDPCWGDTPDD